MLSSHFQGVVASVPLQLSNGVPFGRCYLDNKTIVVSLNMDTCDIDDLTLLIDEMRFYNEAENPGDLAEGFIFEQHNRSFESADNAFEFVFTRCQSRYLTEFSDDHSPVP